MVILRENDWAEQMIASHSLGKKPSETLRRVARYYMDEGYSNTGTRKKLDSFLLQCEPGASLPKWSDALDYAVNRASKYDSVNIAHVDITDRELAKIDVLDSTQMRRLAFTLLCLAKYWKLIIPDSNYWVNNKDTEIMAMANISTSVQRQGMLYYNLRELGMIQFSKKVDNTNVRVCFVEDGESVLQIKDFRNLGYQYLMYRGEPYFECQNCGIVTKLNNPENKRRQKYCKECAAKIKLKQNVESAMRSRYYKKNKNVGN